MSLKPYPEYKKTQGEWIDLLPSSWNLVPLKHICDFQNGDAFNSEDWDNEGIEIIRIQNLNGGEEFNRIPRSLVLDKYIIKKGDLLFGWSGNKGTSFGPFVWERDGI